MNKLDKSPQQNKQLALTDQENKQRMLPDTESKQRMLLDLESKQRMLLDLENKQRMLSGLDNKLEAALTNQNVRYLTDFCRWLPFRYLVRTLHPAAKDFTVGKQVILKLEVEKLTLNNFKHYVVASCSSQQYKSFLPVKLLFMIPKLQSPADYFAWIKSKLPVGSECFVAGVLRQDSKQHWQLVNPPYLTNKADQIPLVEPVYPRLAKLSNHKLIKQLRPLLQQVPHLDEWLPQQIIDRYAFPSWHDAVLALHLPPAAQPAYPDQKARARLSFDELLARQLELAVRYADYTKSAQEPLIFSPQLGSELTSYLPFQLRKEQQAILENIYTDLAATKPMLRLIQGEVGSGKTIIALLAALAVAKLGKQSAFLAPTVILAEQHYQNLAPLAAQAGVKIALLSRAATTKQRLAVEREIASGQVQIVIGTHALLNKNLQFADLRLAIIDEQQRFGVLQRSALCRRGGVDLLMLTATPIPRTQVLLNRGYMQVDFLKSPLTRSLVKTSLVEQKNLLNLTKKIAPLLAQKQQAYWVCTQVKTKATPATVEERAALLQRNLPGFKIGVLHGKLKPSEKQQVIDQFKTGAIAVLVTTTVIEVGVDIPQVCLMVVEDAERFGLAQLHQLRGRIGRADLPGHFMLLTSKTSQTLTSTAKQRLLALRNFVAGQQIAEMDLQTRGPGQLYGKLQSGKAPLTVATVEDAELFLPEINSLLTSVLQERELQLPKQLQQLLLIFGS